MSCPSFQDDIINNSNSNSNHSLDLDLSIYTQPPDISDMNRHDVGDAVLIDNGATENANSHSSASTNNNNNATDTNTSGASDQSSKQKRKSRLKSRSSGSSVLETYIPTPSESAVVALAASRARVAAAAAAASAAASSNDKSSNNYSSDDLIEVSSTSGRATAAFDLTASPPPAKAEKDRTQQQLKEKQKQPPAKKRKTETKTPNPSATAETIEVTPTPKEAKKAVAKQSFNDIAKPSTAPPPPTLSSPNSDEMEIVRKRLSVRDDNVPKPRSGEGSSTKQPYAKKDDAVSASSKPAANPSATNTTTNTAPASDPSDVSAITDTASKKKKKKKKRSFHDQILYTMLTSCRPHSLKTLAKACDTTVEALKHAMLSFLDKGLVICKEFPSKKGEPKKLYWANPMTLSEMNNGGAGTSKGSKGSAIARDLSKLLASSEEMEEATQTKQQLERKHRAILEELNPLLGIPTMKELDDNLAEEENALKAVEDEIQAIKERMASIAAGASSQQPSGTSYYPHNRSKEAPSKPQDPTTLKRRINNMLGEYKARKRKCMDFVDELADAMEKKPKDVTGEKILCLDTDEMEWGCWEDCTTGKVSGVAKKSCSIKRGLLGKKGQDTEPAPIVKIPAKYKDV
eukprot:g11824.t1 g11824   contig6:653133-655022(+)